MKLVGAADDDEPAAEPEPEADAEAVLETVVPNPPEVDDAAGTVRVFEPEPVADAEADPEDEAADDTVDEAEEEVLVGAAPMLNDGVWSKIWALLVTLMASRVYVPTGTTPSSKERKFKVGLTLFARANVSWNASVLTSSKEKGGSEATLDQLMFTTELECQSTGVARSRAEDQGARARAATRLSWDNMTNGGFW